MLLLGEFFSLFCLNLEGLFYSKLVLAYFFQCILKSMYLIVLAYFSQCTLLLFDSVPVFSFSSQFNHAASYTWKLVETLQGRIFPLYLGGLEFRNWLVDSSTYGGSCSIPAFLEWKHFQLGGCCFWKFLESCRRFIKVNY